MINITDLHRLENENEEQFIFRLGQAKDSGNLDMSWDEIANIINKEFRTDESEYRSEAAYRKPYQQAKRYFEANVFKTYKDEDSYFKELQVQKDAVYKEKRKLYDQRREYNKLLISDARAEHLCEELIKAANRYGLNVPRDIGVVGFDNIEVASIAVPSITTINQPAFQIGFTAGETMFERIRDPEAKPSPILLDTELISRDSIIPFHCKVKLS